MTAEELASFCPGGQITDIQCVDSDSLDDWSSLSQASCTVEEGLQCINLPFFDSPSCRDYKIRYMCNCSDSTATKPSRTTTEEILTTQPPLTTRVATTSAAITPAPDVVCLSGWTTWINDDNPASGNGDLEKKSAQELAELCPGGEITDIECVDSDTLDDWISLSQASCTVEEGLQCINLPFLDAPSCRDYKIRYMCNCTDASSLGGTDPSPQSSLPSSSSLPNGPPNTLPKDLTTLVPKVAKQETTVPSVPCKSQWSPWINRDTPATSDGDYEKMTAEELASFCPGGQITDIQCVDSDSLDDWSSLSQASCTVEEGLQCINLPFFDSPSCRDYKIRYMCNCSSTQNKRIRRSVGQFYSAPPTSSVTNIPAECQSDMGFHDRRVHNAMISASSARDSKHAAHTARLGTRGTWVPTHSDTQQYIQVDFKVGVYLTGITTQGQADGPSHVTSYKVMHSKDGINWNTYREFSGVDKVFQANSDSSTPVTNLFGLPILTRFLQIKPQTWHNRIALRLEIHGCPQQYPAVVLDNTLQLKPEKKATFTDLDTLGDCLEWDHWVDTHQPSLQNQNDIASINDLADATPVCKYPIAIECRTATPDHRSSKATDQDVICNLWDGLVCNASHVKEPFCFNYEVRLGCLKSTPECVSEASWKTNSAKVPNICYQGMDTSRCPKAGCAKGLYCNGQKCVPKTECPCLSEETIVKPGGVVQTSKCETCQCLGGEMICLPKDPPTCPVGQPVLDKTSCTYSCSRCAQGDYQCGNGMCVSLSKRCDGVIDCQDDELGCSTIPVFQPHKQISSDMLRLGEMTYTA
ncbi:mucin 5ac, oligomeric mucus/gel-forming [Plakobranchus ocellatus]|uniref:Mucin 5ac, oligomeric mucus/gel-forming n=1 Tax=Plakobranchus ocellatus TaxID=259542 RepID=A0AAV3XZG1_9GAST|nr:mucin 5ac, oligomeric mucus/gel-forming [Plakobranchus ocellatus]